MCIIKAHGWLVPLLLHALSRSTDRLLAIQQDKQSTEVNKRADLADLGIASQAVDIFQDSHGGRGAGCAYLDHRTPLCKARPLLVVLLQCRTRNTTSLLADWHPLRGPHMLYLKAMLDQQPQDCSQR